jgi:hypothetical protein
MVWYMDKNIVVDKGMEVHIEVWGTEEEGMVV